MSNKLVSCIIPSYKRCETVVRAVNSVLNQTYQDVEVLVVDDNIPGDSYSLDLNKELSKIKDSRVRLITQTEHINGAKARNVGIEKSLGEYIAFLDDDDEWHPEKIEKQVAYLESNPNVGGCTALYKMWNQNEVVRTCPIYSDDDLQFHVLLRSVSMYTSTFIGRKETILKFGAFNIRLLRNQDVQFFADFLSLSPIHLIPEFLVDLHDDSAINRPNLEKTIGVKKVFLEIEENNIKKYPRNKQRRIYAAHNFEIALVALKGKQWSLFLKYSLKFCFYPPAYLDIYNRIKKHNNG